MFAAMHSLVILIYLLRFGKAVFWDLFEGDIAKPLAQHRHAFRCKKGLFFGRIQHTYILLQQ